MSVKGKIVIITGGAMGIGRFVAGTFATEGARLAIADIAPMDTVAREVEALGAEVFPVKTDITVEAEVRSLMEQVNRHYGRIDVLLNNAAIVTHFNAGRPRWPRIRDMDQSFFEKVIRTNLMGTILCTKHVVPYMEKQRSGHIINVGQGSVARETTPGSLGSCVYGTTKVAIRAFTQRVAPEEREFNICIVSMGPGSADGRRGIITEGTPEENRPFMSPIESVGNRYVIAAEAPMEFTGHQVSVRNGVLEIAPN